MPLDVRVSLPMAVELAARDKNPCDKAPEYFNCDGQNVDRLFHGSSENNRFGIGTGRILGFLGTFVRCKCPMEDDCKMDYDGV